MTNLAKHSASVLICTPRPQALILPLLVALALVTAQPAQAQVFTVLHDFSGGQDGGIPYSGLVLDRAGNLYGTTAFGANPTCLEGCGTAFRISRAGVLTTLFRFNGQNGETPEGNLTMAADGRFYGTTEFGGVAGTGNVYWLQPPSRAVGNATGTWNEGVIYDFVRNGTGVDPAYGSLISDGAGNLYGTASGGGITGGGCGNQGCGVVFEFTPANGGWTYTVLYRFTGGTDGATLSSGVVRDSAGRLYGTAGGDFQYPYGTVYQLVPTGSGWQENTIYAFQGGADGDAPAGGLAIDSAGNLYGVTGDGGAGGGGVVYELSPSGDSWAFTTIYSLVGGPGGGSLAAPTLDSAGNLYGTAGFDGAFYHGSVFKLTHNNGTWSYTDLYDFTDGADGADPIGAMAIDANGNLYGTSSLGGSGGNCEYGCGAAWKITP